MKARRLEIAVSVAAGLAAIPGCLVPQTQLLECQAQNRALSEQNRAQWAELENLKVHSRNTENNLMRTEEELALLQDRVGLDGKRLGRLQRERAALGDPLYGLGGRAPLSPQSSRQLEGLARRFPSLHYDPALGVAKLDTDILFDSGQAELKPAAQKLLHELASALKSPEQSELKVVVVGHTDDRAVAKRPARDQYPNNFHLSTARALAVADQLRQAGIAEPRVGIAGMGSHQPIASNDTATDRQKNRRVEIFVMAPDVPVVGWTESVPSVY